jgi:hypothetical protein
MTDNKFAQAAQAVTQALQAGQEVKNPEALKQSNVIVGYLVSILSMLVALAKLNGIDINVDADTLTVIAMGFVALYGFSQSVLTAITSKRSSANPFAKPKAIRALNKPKA